MIIGVDIRVLGTGRASGVEEYTERLLAHMIPLDLTVQYKLFYSGRRPLVRRAWMDAPNVSVHEFRSSNQLLFLRTRLTGWPYLDELVGGADVFFFPHFLLGATSPHCRRVMTWHDLSYERMPEFLSWGRRLWHRLYMRPRQQAQKADRIIAVSDSTRADLIDMYGISPERVVRVYSGVDGQLQRPSEEALQLFRRRERLPARFILALGTIEPRKNIEGLIAAFDQLARQSAYADTHLVLVGSHGWLERPIQERIAASPWRERIHIHGAVGADERAYWLSAASVLAYPSFLEGFGFPPLEAMACGTPVVVGANSSLFETVGDAGVLVNPYSIDAISRGIGLLLSDEAIRATMITRGYQRAAAYPWQATAEQMLAYIKSI